MGELQELVRNGTGDSFRDSSHSIKSSDLLTSNNLNLLTRTASNETQSLVDNLFGKVSFSNQELNFTPSSSQRRDYYNFYGNPDQQNLDDKSVRTYNQQQRETSDDKADRSGETQPQRSNESGKQSWGGDEKARKQRHKPMEVELNPDGSATVTVKKGDTVWDIARRMLEEQGKHQNPPHKPTNKEILEKTKELVQQNGGSHLRVGQKFKIGAGDVQKTESARGETHVATDEKGNRKINRADGSSTTIEAGQDGQPAKITEDDGKGNKREYSRGQDGKWRDAQGNEVKVEIDKEGTVTITEANGTVRKSYADGRVETASKSGDTTYTVKRDKSGAVTEIVTVNVQGRNHVYQKMNGEWTRDGQCVTDLKVVEVNGEIKVSDPNGQFTVKGDGTVTKDAAS